MKSNHQIDRRHFLKTSAAAAVGVSLASPLTSEGIGVDKTTAAPKIRSYRPLGRTGFRVSDISLGYSNNVGVIKAALKAGVNYIDTAEVYGNQAAVGKAIKGVDRKKVFITSKLVIDGKKDRSKASFIKRFNNCLKELDTAYIDCMMIHSSEAIETLFTKGFHDAMDQMKREGKLRFVGVSNHGSNEYAKPKVSMEAVLTAAANDGRFDVMLLAYNFIQEDGGAKILKLCKLKNIGTTLMKVDPVSAYHRLNDQMEKMNKSKKKINPLFKSQLKLFAEKVEKAEGFIKKYRLDSQKEISDAAVKFCLDNNDAATVCCGMRNFDQLEGFIRLSGTTLSGNEKRKLAAYKAGPGAFYCRHACGLCENSCEKGVPVNTIMRFNHYYEAHGREKYGIKQYARLGGIRAEHCTDCAGHCQSNCPYGVPIQGLLTIAHDNLSLG